MKFCSFVVRIWSVRRKLVSSGSVPVRRSDFDEIIPVWFCGKSKRQVSPLRIGHPPVLSYRLVGGIDANARLQRLGLIGCAYSDGVSVYTGEPIPVCVGAIHNVCLHALP